MTQRKSEFRTAYSSLSKQSQTSARPASVAWEKSVHALQEQGRLPSDPNRRALAVAAYMRANFAHLLPRGDDDAV